MKGFHLHFTQQEMLNIFNKVNQVAFRYDAYFNHVFLGSGVEICYELYSPRIQQIEVLKLEKRLDDNLMYLRDALPEYCTVDPDMKPEPISPTGEVPVNKVREH